MTKQYNHPMPPLDVAMNRAGQIRRFGDAADGEQKKMVVLADEIERLRSYWTGDKLTGGSDVCHTCQAHCVVIGDKDAEIEALRRQQHQLNNELTAARLENDRLRAGLTAAGGLSQQPHGSHMSRSLEAIHEIVSNALAGAAAEPAAGGIKCVHCNGKGTETQVYDEGRGGWSDPDIPCETCGGTGRIRTVEQYLKTLPADWHQDSSTRTWFPLLDEEVERLRRAEISCMRHHVGSAEKSAPEPNPARECQCATYCMAAAGMTWDPQVKCRGLTGKDPGAHLRYPRR